MRGPGPLDWPKGVLAACLVSPIPSARPNNTNPAPLSHQLLIEAQVLPFQIASNIDPIDAFNLDPTANSYLFETLNKRMVRGSSRTNAKLARSGVQIKADQINCQDGLQRRVG